MNRAFWAALALGLTPAISHAAPIVTYTLLVDSNGPGTWSVLGQASVGDNEGIATWGVRLNNVDRLATPDAPWIRFLQSDVVDLGFHDSSNFDFDPGATGSTTHSIGSAQDVTVPPTMPPVYGFGQELGQLTVPGGATFISSSNTTATVSYNAMLLLAHGTYSGAAPVFAQAGNSASVFTSRSNTTLTGAAVVLVPEPASLASLLAVAGLTMLRRRRSSQI